MGAWRKQPIAKGYSSVCQSERGYILIENSETVITVELYQRDSWYWYGCGRNTARENIFFKTKELAKIDADTFYKTFCDF